MGLLEMSSKVVTTYKADVSEHVRELKKLKGTQDELRQAELEASEARNHQLEGWKKGLEQIGVGIAAALEIAHLAFEGYNEMIKESRLETAAMGIDIERLGEAAGGLKTHMELLEFAAKANKSAFHNTQEDMETAEKAMRALEARGYSTAEAQDAVTNAMVTGKTKGLEPFGIVVDKHIDKLQMLGEENLTLAQKTEIHKHALEALKIVAEDVSEGQDNIGDSMKRTEVKLADAWAELKKGLGELVVSMQPLLSALAEAVKMIAEIAKYAHLTDSSPMRLLKDGVDASSSFLPGLGSPAAANPNVLSLAPKLTNMPDMGEYIQGYGYSGAVTAQPDGVGLGEFSKLYDSYVNPWEKDSVGAVGDRAEAFVKAAMAKYKLSQEQAKAFREELKKLAGKEAKEFTDKLVTSLSAEIEGDEAKQRASDTSSMIAGSLAGTQIAIPADFAATIAKTGAAANDNIKHDKANSKLEKIFGKVGDFDVYKEAFKSLGGAVSSALNAWVDGSMSAGAAFKKFIGEALKGLSSQMLIESLKHAAYALGSLAFGDVRGAGQHAVAAAAFAAGGLAAGIAAKELGAGTSNAGAGARGASASGSQVPTYQGGAANSNSPIIVYGDSFADDSPRMRQIRAQKFVGLALGNSAVSYG